MELSVGANKFHGTFCGTFFGAKIGPDWGLPRGTGNIYWRTNLSPFHFELAKQRKVWKRVSMGQALIKQHVLDGGHDEMNTYLTRQWSNGSGEFIMNEQVNDRRRRK